MDPADTEANLPGFSLHQAVSFQGVLLGQHSQMLQGIMETLNQLSISVSHMEGQQAHPTPFSPPLAFPVSNNQPRKLFISSTRKIQWSSGSV